jgi:hypothetical protein
MKLRIMFVAVALAFATGVGAIALRATPAAADFGNACIYKPEPIECACTTCS